MAVRGRATRLERDSLGTMRVPADACYGIETLRALRNFPISGLRAPDELVDAAVRVKRAAADVNAALGRLDRRRARAIVRAADEVLAGKLRDQFVVDAFAMGAGTAFHMNVNEVLANRAAEILGGRRGDRARVDPHDHVNAGQSTNDVFPTAMRLAALAILRERLDPEIRAFGRSLAAKGKEFDRVLKSGRTHLQDAVPIRLGQEFAAYGAAVEKGRGFLEVAARSLRELGIGGTAVGTGLNADPRYPRAIVRALSAATGERLHLATDPREAMQSLRPFAEVSAALRNLALELIRIANDLRLLSSGPRTGLAEISLPAVAPGSSIMPGKVNPSMLEMLDMVGFRVMGADATIAAAVQAGQLELNVMMPVVAEELLFAMRILGNALREARTRCIDGIRADEARARHYAEASLGLATALSPAIGYDRAARAAREAAWTGESILEVVRRLGFIDERRIGALLDPARMTSPRPPDRPPLTEDATKVKPAARRGRVCEPRSRRRP